MGKSGVKGKMKKQRYDLNDLGSNVKMMRKARKISQVKLSEGRTLISLEILVKLADVFDCSVEDILLCSQEKVKAVN